MLTAKTNQQEGIVIETAGRVAKVKTSRHNDCASCGACPGNAATVLEAVNRAGAKAGQNVVIEIQEANMLTAAFTVYLLPLLAVFLGVVAGGEIAGWLEKPETMLQVIGGVAAFISALVYIKYYNHSVRIDEKMKPVIISKI